MHSRTAIALAVASRAITRPSMGLLARSMSDAAAKVRDPPLPSQGHLRIPNANGKAQHARGDRRGRAAWAAGAGCRRPSCLPAPGWHTSWELPRGIACVTIPHGGSKLLLGAHHAHNELRRAQPRLSEGEQRANTFMSMFIIPSRRLWSLVMASSRERRLF